MLRKRLWFIIINGQYNSFVFHLPSANTSSVKLQILLKPLLMVTQSMIIEFFCSAVYKFTTHYVIAKMVQYKFSLFS